MPTTGMWIKSKLIAAGERGCVIADLHKERKAEHERFGILYKGGTYPSFRRFFRWLIQLGWVERTEETETSYAKGDSYELKNPRTFYRITSEGLTASDLEWSDPLYTKHPEWAGGIRSRYVSTGVPVGRPRKELLPQLRKGRMATLSEEDKEKLLDEFRQIFKREPTQLEIYNLFLEEVKLRRRGKPAD